VPLNDLPEPVRRLLEALGVRELYPIQRKAVEAGVLRGRSLLVSAPTASGKTLVAMMAIVSRLSDAGGRAFYVAPLRSIALEKYRDFKKLEGLGYSVRVSVGDLERGLPGADIVVTTYEKLDSTARSNPGLLREASVVVVDEIHYVNDPKRGPLLEGLIARILGGPERPQLVALSATVPNSSEIAGWLGAELVESDWRPVPLREGVLDGDEILYSDGSRRRIYAPTGKPYVDLVADLADEGGHALVFVQSRRRAIQLAKQASKHSGLLGYDEAEAREWRSRILDSAAPAPVREELADLVGRGVAFHHAGLGNELRGLVEEAFRAGALAAVYATPTLAAGVNLPARRVVVAEYVRYEHGYRRPISVSEYKQLAGRAGRPHMDEYGEAVIVPHGRDEPGDLIEYYIRGEPERVESRLSGLRGLRHVVLGLVASGQASTLDEVMAVVRRTLYARQRGESLLAPMVEAALRQLVDWGLLERFEGNAYRATPVGFEASRYYVDPETVKVFIESVRSLGPGAEPSDAQLLYIIASTPDMPRLPVSRRESEELLDTLLDVAPEVYDLVDYIGWEESSSIKAALVLMDWIEEVPEERIFSKYDVWPGDLYAIIDAGRWLASALSSVSDALAWRGVASRLRVLEARIRHGVKAELLELVGIPGVGRVRARRLYEAGYKSLADLASAEPSKLLGLPGLGPSTVASIMEFFGRREEAERIRRRLARRGRGLTAFMD